MVQSIWEVMLNKLLLHASLIEWITPPFTAIAAPSIIFYLLQVARPGSCVLVVLVREVGGAGFGTRQGWCGLLAGFGRQGLGVSGAG